MYHFGTAGWSLPSELHSLFPGTGSHLERYARALSAVEINSSFYRHHQAKTYARWAQSVPKHFRFSVKLAKAFTHEARLSPSGDSLRDCILGICELGEKFGVLLVQLPPSLLFEHQKVENFIGFLREVCPAEIAWEPRHPSWTQPEALALLEKYEITKVIADPEPCPTRFLHSDDRLRYYRLHGRPVIYRSRYQMPFLRRLGRAIQDAPSRTVWCIFDNTTFGYALKNAIELGALTSGLASDRIVS